MNEKILYVVNNDSTTSIPLEVAGVLVKSNLELKTIIYYKDSKYPSNNFIENSLNIGAKYTFDIRGIATSAKLIRSTKPDVIHAHHSWSAFIFFLLAKFIVPSSKLIKTEHSKHDFARGQMGRWYQIVLNFLIFLMADLVVCNSKSTLKSFSFLEKKITNGRTVVCYNGVNIKEIENAQLYKTSNGLISGVGDSLIVGSVGRLIKEKDYTSLVEAFSLVKAQVQQNIKLVLVGDGPEEDNLKDKAIQLGIRKDVIFTGIVKRKLAYKLLKKMDIFVMTSKYEGFCNTLVEAMAAAKPVVCSNINTLREVAGNAALFGEVGKSEAFANQILKLIQDQELRKEMKRRAGERAKKFTLEACAERYMSYYETS